MTIGIILIVSILLLGGVLATLGDRIGTKVGKARLSLFNLRPRKTATVVTIVTGVMIAGTTLGILFATSEPLRRGIFAYDQTLKKLRGARRELKETRVQKIHVEKQLAQARQQYAGAQEHLEQINQSLEAALAQQSVTDAKLAQTQNQLSQVTANFEQTQSQLKDLLNKFKQAQGKLSRVSGQVETLGAEITQLQRERQELIAQRDEVKRQIEQLNLAIAQRDREIGKQDLLIADRDEIIAQRNQMIADRDGIIAQLDSKIADRDRQIADRDDIIAQREVRLKGLETQQSFLERQVNMLQQYYQEYQELRQGNVALLRGQILADGVVRILSPQAAKDAVDHLLRQANTVAISQVTSPDGNAAVDEQVVQITQAEVEQLTKKISNGKDYVVRILSAGNYVHGEHAVRVFADVAVNKIVFMTGDVVASGSVDASRMSEDEILQRIDLLMDSSKFRARRAGILGSTIQIADGSPKTLVQFIEQLKDYQKPLEIQAVASEVTYTAGPLKMKLVAIRDGKVLFRT